MPLRNLLYTAVTDASSRLRRRKDLKSMVVGSLGRWVVGLVIATGLCAWMARTAASSDTRDAIKAGELFIDPPTLHCLGFRWKVEGDDNGNAHCDVSYRKSGDEEWKKALPLLRVNREQTDKAFNPYRAGNMLAGSVL